MAGLPRSIPEILKRAVAGELSGCHVALPGKVVAYSATTNLADVQLMIQQSVWDDDNGRTFEDVGTLPGVPVVWPRAGGFKMTLPMQVGDTGLLVFCSDSIGEWRLTGQSSQPQGASRMSVDWPVFIPGLTPDITKVSASDPGGTKAIFGQDGGEQIQCSTGSIQIGASASKPAAFGDVNDTNWTAAKTLASALSTFEIAMEAFLTATITYVATIQPVADPSNAASPPMEGAATTLTTAAAALVTACSTFAGAVLPTITTVAKVK